MQQQLHMQFQCWLPFSLSWCQWWCLVSNPRPYYDAASSLTLGNCRLLWKSKLNFDFTSIQVPMVMAGLKPSTIGWCGEHSTTVQVPLAMSINLKGSNTNQNCLTIIHFNQEWKKNNFFFLFILDHRGQRLPRFVSLLFKLFMNKHGQIHIFFMLTTYTLVYYLGLQKAPYPNRVW